MLQFQAPTITVARPPPSKGATLMGEASKKHLSPAFQHLLLMTNVTQQAGTVCKQVLAKQGQNEVQTAYMQATQTSMIKASSALSSMLESQRLPAW
jgi:hypothetical protein